MEKLKSASVIVENIIGLVENAIINKDYRYLNIKKKYNNNSRNYRRKNDKINNQQPLGINYNN